VQPAHAVDDAGRADREHRHVERLVGPAGVHAAEVEELVAREAEGLAVGAEVAVHLVGAEHVDACRHGRVRGEDAAGGHDLESLAEGQPVLRHQVADALQPEERAVALVHVEDAGPELERQQRADAADAEHRLLADAHLRVAAVQLVGHVLQVRRVFRDVGVEQHERDAPDLRAPGTDDDGPSCEFHLHAQRRAVGRVARAHRHDGEVVDGIPFLLPSLLGEVLAKVALLVEQPDADEGDAEFTRRLEVVAGEDAEAARVDGQALGEAELHREVRDQRARRRPNCFQYQLDLPET